MAQQKKQHYVPQFYLNNFAHNEKFSILRISNREIKDNIPYKSQCQKDYFYGRDLKMENKLSKLEKQSAEIISKILNKETINKDEIKIIKKFIISQDLRTNAQLKHQIHNRDQLAFEVIKSNLNYYGFQLSDKEIKGKIANYKNETLSPTGFLDNVDKFTGEISDLGLAVIEFCTHSSLVSSDSPVITINYLQRHANNYDSLGLLIFLPISPKLLIVLYDSNVYPALERNFYHTCKKNNDVIELNKLQLYSADEIVYGKHDDLLKYKLKDWELKKVNTENLENSLHKMGPKNRKLIMWSKRGIVYHQFNFSFIPIDIDFKKIRGKLFYEIPRDYNQKTLEDLKIFQSIIPPSQIQKYYNSTKTFLSQNKLIIKTLSKKLHS